MKGAKIMDEEIDFSVLQHIIKVTEPDTPLNDAYHVGSF